MSTLTPTDLLHHLDTLSQRAQQQSFTLPEEDAVLGDGWSAVGFQVGDSRFLVSLDETREIFPLPQKLASVPNSQQWVLGIIGIRGELLPVLDLQNFMDHKPTLPSKASRVIMMNNTLCSAGLLVDEIYGLQHFDVMPETTDTKESSYIHGSVLHEETRWHVISFNHLANDERFMNVAA